ncbi:hypothetical protein LOTGIDRAFT_235077 [Lottia gigantea]|uniref:Saposin B-type domain-containing protein n=1 Tax=Lottia gigantea TaxID=225164 RepID=V4A299_LOTGI|nr:hypothetical protein LOTGIDRAFT_235077 [Lottia gigantea]ESO87396.1 hypothetical protein LOTGIDRAFT_235077 [Lottia gigantea]
MKISNYWIVALTCVLDFILCTKDLPDNLSKELYCAGCEFTVKALDKLLKGSSNEAYDIRVLETLTTICDKETFIESDYSPVSMQLACNTLLEKNEAILEPYLVSHYSRIERNSYSELLQQICHSISAACTNVSRKKMEKLKIFHVSEDGNININEDEWKTPKPMKESRNEL